MHRVNRSAPWKERAKAGVAPDLTVRECQKGDSGRHESLAHLTRSASMYWRNSAGELPTGSEPSVRMRSRMSAWLRFLTISARSRANIEVGSFLMELTEVGSGELRFSNQPIAVSTRRPV